MPKVPLKVVGNTNRIEAPDFCPYASSDFYKVNEIHSIAVRVISPDICSVCKICTFVPISEGPAILTEEETKRCIDYLTSFNGHLSNIVSGQISFLTKKNRSVLALLISANILDNTLAYAVEDDRRREALFRHYTADETPIFYLYGSPVYFSRKLTLSPIQVVGEAPWK